MLFSFLSYLHENRISAKECHNTDHDQVLQRDEHIKLKPEAVVETKDRSKAKVEPDARRWEWHVWDVDADLEPSNEHEQDWSDAK